MPDDNALMVQDPLLQDLQSPRNQLLPPEPAPATPLVDWLDAAIERLREGQRRIALDPDAPERQAGRAIAEGFGTSIGATKGVGGSGKALREAELEGRVAKAQQPTTLERTIAATEGQAAKSDTPILDRLLQDENRVSTRIPTAKPAKGVPVPIDPHTIPDLRIGIDAARQSADAYQANVDLLSGYPDIPVSATPMAQALTPAEQDAVAQYAGQSFWVNGTAPEAEPARRALDTAIAKSPLDANTVLWRGFGADPDLVKALEVGNVVPLSSGHVSTSIDRNVAQEFADISYSPDETSVLVRIETPNGTKALRVPTAPEFHRDPDNPVDHGEFLLPRGTQFRIKERREVSDGRLQITVEPVTSTTSTHDDRAERAIDHLADNLVFLHDSYKEQHGQGVVDRATKWYEGANKIAHDLAEKYGYAPRQVASVLANLSPQKDWYQNADLALRMIDIVKHKAGDPWSDGMTEWANKYTTGQQADLDKKLAKAGMTIEQVRQGIAAAVANGEKPPKALMALHRRQNAIESDRETFEEMRRAGLSLRELNDPESRARWLRAYDEANNAKSYPSVTPEGEFGPSPLNKDKSEKSISWGSFGEIGKALASLDADDLRAISIRLGGNHKVRSFFNNIISPNSTFDDTTIDTHAIAAAHLRPLGAGAAEVKAGLGMGGSSSNATGSQGLYGLYHEAYRRAAERVGLLPRQMQSVTWEAVRGLFSPEDKRSKAYVQQNSDIWGQFSRGEITAAEARKRILEMAKGISPPSWHSGAPETGDDEND